MLAQQSRPFTNNASGNLNQRQTHLKNKLIDLEDLDVEILSPHFLQTKTLKKPLSEHQLQLNKTNPYGINSYHPIQHLSSTPSPTSPPTVTFQKEITKAETIKPQSLSLIDTSQLNIKPAYKLPETHTNIFQSTNAEEMFHKDKNTILAAILKKGGKTEVTVKPKSEQPQEKKKIGPAQAKLKAMMKKRDLDPTIEVTISKEPKIRQTKARLEADQIGEEINEQIDQYGNESFEKLSVGYESAIKESIAATESNVIKESIRQSIRESVRESISGSAGQIKESIREDIKQSMGGSSRSLKEDIIEQISESKPKDESIQQVYQQIFEDVQGSNSLSKSQSRFKKSQNLKEDSFSQSASKSFRMKTNVVKSLKYAEQLLKKEKEYIVSKSIESKMKEQVTKERDSLKQIQQKMNKFMAKPSFAHEKAEKNKDLYYQFKVQLNRLISGGNFQTKLKKLVSFLSIGSDVAPDRKAVDDLQESVLKNVMMQIESIRAGKDHLSKIQDMKAQYEQKLNQELLIQEVKLRAEMNQKLSQKDFELKKMIAELQSRMMSRPFQGHYQPGESSFRASQYEVDSDYSIDSSNVSWKADLWELLPEFEKKKLYDKQSAQVTQFLADIMIKEIQEEALDRSIDISFQFPQQYNNIPINFQPIQKNKQPQRIDQPPRQVERKSSSDFLSDLPKLSIRKPNASPEVSAEPEKEEELKSQKICRDEKIKAEIIKILAEYKPLFLRKKGEVVRNLMRVVMSKENDTQKYMLSSLLQIGILSERESKKEHKMYLRAYEEELLMSLVGVYNSSLNHRQADIEDQMRKKYDRLLVVCQVAIADKCSERVALDCERSMKYNVINLTREAILEMEQHPCPIDIPANENYMQLKCCRQEKQIKKEIVNQIVGILAAEFAAQFPKKRK